MEKLKMVSLSEYFIHLLFALYFIILFAERIQSLVRSATDPSVKMFKDGFNGYTFAVTMVSLAVSVIYLLITNGSLFVGMFTRSANVHENVNMGALCVATGLILVSGMVHTEHTAAPVQFAAYGALIVAIIIQTAMRQGQSESPVLLWMSAAFLTAFSMAIPVMYRSNIERATLFHVLEAVTAIVLIVMFTFMLHKVFCGDATDLFYAVPMLTALVLDTILIVMQREEKINWFVLIALIATVAVFLTGVITRLFLSK